MDQLSDTELHPRRHAVKFYGSDQSLFATVGGFLAEGLVSAQPAIVIATPDHRIGILDDLETRLIEIDRAQSSGDLIVVDAEDLLDRFMAGDAPDPKLFDEHVGGLIAETLRARNRTTLRAYGEMVNVLWQSGQPDAAIALEMLWNKLALTYGFALLCGYSMGSFYKQSAQHQEVVRLHSDVIETETTVVRFTPTRARSA